MDLKKILFRKVSLYWLIITLLFFCIITFSFNRLMNISSNNQIIKRDSKEKHQIGYTYISPLLECADNQYLNRSELETKINRLVHKELNQNRVSHISIYFRDLNNGPWFGINENEKFTPASLLKVPILIAYLKIAEDYPEILEEKIKIDSIDQSFSQNILPLRKVELNKTYSIAELLDYMIIYSDNNAANHLLSYIKPEDLNRIYFDLNIQIPGEEFGTENFMTVRDYASFFRILYNASYLNADMSERALHLLTHSNFNDGLKASIPRDIEIAHKFGERVTIDSKQLHDCGIIYEPSRPYLICIMTRGNNFNNMSQVIQELSQNIYEEIRP